MSYFGHQNSSLTISEVIKVLSDIQTKHGDIMVRINTPKCCCDLTSTDNFRVCSWNSLRNGRKYKTVELG